MKLMKRRETGNVMLLCTDEQLHYTRLPRVNSIQAMHLKVLYIFFYQKIVLLVHLAGLTGGHIFMPHVLCSYRTKYHTKMQTNFLSTNFNLQSLYFSS
jgi:hypothetical protein